MESRMESDFQVAGAGRLNDDAEVEGTEVGHRGWGLHWAYIRFLTCFAEMWWHMVTMQAGPVLRHQCVSWIADRACIHSFGWQNECPKAETTSFCKKHGIIYGSCIRLSDSLLGWCFPRVSLAVMMPFKKPEEKPLTRRDAAPVAGPKASEGCRAEAVWPPSTVYMLCLHIDLCWFVSIIHFQEFQLDSLRFRLTSEAAPLPTTPSAPSSMQQRHRRMLFRFVRFVDYIRGMVSIQFLSRESFLIFLD